MKTVQVTLDEALLERVDCAARAEDTALSEFIRSRWAGRSRTTAAR